LLSRDERGTLAFAVFGVPQSKSELLGMILSEIHQKLHIDGQSLIVPPQR
jgi:hypothetical protein